MKNKGDTQDELTRELTEPAQQGAQLEELQIEHVQEETFVKFPREQMAGRHVREVLGEKACAVMRSPVEKALTGQEVFWEGDVPFPDGIIRRVDASYTPHIDSG